MRFEDDFISRVRNSVDIVELIGTYVKLKKSGQNFLALCPFHNEKTPSFSVSDSKQIFKCFGCGVGGDVFHFISQIERLSFPEAVEHLAERSGIPLPEQERRTKSSDDRRPRLYQVMKAADEFFRSAFLDTSAPRAYLQSRQIGKETIDRFGIGFAPPGNQLRSEMESLGFTLKEMDACGLLRSSGDGEYYDKFRNRVTFPIQDLRGRTIAFGGRSLGDAPPKYLNSPETPLYVKGNSLYALNITQSDIRRRDFAILVEGYFDCLVPFQFGVTNVVASLGTSLTHSQVRLLGRYTRNVVVNFDPDSAGVAAAMRSIDIFLEQGFHVNVLELPSGEDPDSFILKNGVEPYRELLKSSSPYLEFLLSHFMAAQRDPFSPTGKRAVVGEMIPYLMKISDRIERSEYISKVASRLKIKEDLLIQEMRKHSRPTERQEALSLLSSQNQPTPSEKRIVAALLEKEDQDYVLSQLLPELFEGLRTERIFESIFKLRNQKREISVLSLRELLVPEDVDLVERLAVDSEEHDHSQEEIEASISALRKLQVDRISLEIQDALIREEGSGKVSDQLDELLRQKETLRRQQMS